MTDAAPGRRGPRPRLSDAVAQAVAAYAQGAFPMDDADDMRSELPWYATHERAVFSLDAEDRDRLRRKVRRDLRQHAALELVVNAGYSETLALCADPPPGEGRWITPRLASLYHELHAARIAHSFELRLGDGTLAAGIVGVLIGRAALLESMRHVVPGAGNALLSRTLDRLADDGFELCDIQIATEHTTRLGCRLMPRGEFDARLAAAVTKRARLPGTRALQVRSPPGRPALG